MTGDMSTDTIND